MPTYEDRYVIDQLIARRGRYPGDPPALQISEYTNQGGAVAWHVAYSVKELIQFLTSPFVHDVKPLWIDSTRIGITKAK